MRASVMADGVCQRPTMAKRLVWLEGKFVFPCVSTRQIGILGGVFDERLIYTDIWLRDVLRPFKRAIRVPSVTITHHWEGRTADQEVAAVRVQTPEYQQLYTQCVAEGRTKIRHALHGGGRH